MIFRKFIEPVMEDARMRGEPLRRTGGWQEELLVCLRRIYCLSREDGWLTEMTLRNQLPRRGRFSSETVPESRMQRKDIPRDRL